MSNLPEVQRIVKAHIHDDLCVCEEKMGWINEAVFDGCNYDPHNVLIKCGQSMEQIYPALLKLKLPSRLLPRSIAGHGVSEQENDQYFTEKFDENRSLKRDNAVIILTRFDRLELQAFLAREFEGMKQTKKKDRKRLNQDRVKDLSDRAIRDVPLQDEIWEVYIDVCPCIETMWTPMEIKQSGDVDGKKAKSELIDSMLLPYVCLGDKPKSLYFGVIQDTKGLNRMREWGGQLSAWIEPDMLLLGEELFSRLAPDDVSYVEFCKIVVQRIKYLKSKSMSRSELKLQSQGKGKIVVPKRVARKRLNHFDMFA